MSQVDKLIGERVKALRKRHGLSQGKFAKLLGLKTGTGVSYLESGRIEWKVRDLLKVAAYFGRPWQYFIESRKQTGGMR